MPGQITWNLLQTKRYWGCIFPLLPRIFLLILILPIAPHSGTGTIGSMAAGIPSGLNSHLELRILNFCALRWTTACSSYKGSSILVQHSTGQMGDRILIKSSLDVTARLHLHAAALVFCTTVLCAKSRTVNVLFQAHNLATPFRLLNEQRICLAVL